jgi:hypothetical protein
MEFKELPKDYRPLPTDAIRGRRLHRYEPGKIIASLDLEVRDVPEWVLYKGELYHLEGADFATYATYYKEPDFLIIKE